MLIKALFFERHSLKWPTIPIFVLWCAQIGGFTVSREMSGECRKEKEKNV